MTHIVHAHYYCSVIAQLYSPNVGEFKPSHALSSYYPHYDIYFYTFNFAPELCLWRIMWNQGEYSLQGLHEQCCWDFNCSFNCPVFNDKCSIPHPRAGLVVRVGIIVFVALQVPPLFWSHFKSCSSLYFFPENNGQAWCSIIRNLCYSWGFLRG